LLIDREAICTPTHAQPMKQEDILLALSIVESPPV